MPHEDYNAIALDAEGDFEIEEDEFGNKDFRLVHGAEYLVQSARVRLQTTVGEYVLDRDFGFPFEQALGVFNRTFIEGAVRRALAPDPDILAVDRVDIELSVRTREIDVTIAMRGHDDTEAVLEGGLV